jgi:hypothetical protein
LDGLRVRYSLRDVRVILLVGWITCTI